MLMVIDYAYNVCYSTFISKVQDTIEHSHEKKKIFHRNCLLKQRSDWCNATRAITKPPSLIPRAQVGAPIDLPNALLWEGKMRSASYASGTKRIKHFWGKKKKDKINWWMRYWIVSNAQVFSYTSHYLNKSRSSSAPNWISPPRKFSRIHASC